MFPHQNIARAHCSPLKFPYLVVLSCIYHKVPRDKKGTENRCEIFCLISYHHRECINPHNRHHSSIYLISFPDNEHHLECRIFVIFPLRSSKAPNGSETPRCSGFTVTLRHTTDNRTPPDELSARRLDIYLTTHNTHNRQASMSPAGFKPSIPVSKRPQTHASDHAANGVDPYAWGDTINSFSKSTRSLPRVCFIRVFAQISPRMG